MVQAPGAHEQSPAGERSKPSVHPVQGSAGHSVCTISTSQSCSFRLWGDEGWECTKARDQRDLVRPQVPEGRLNTPL